MYSPIQLDSFVEMIDDTLAPLESVPFDVSKHEQARSQVAKQLLDRIGEDCALAREGWVQGGKLPVMKDVHQAVISEYLGGGEALEETVNRQIQLSKELKELKRHDQVRLQVIWLQF